MITELELYQASLEGRVLRADNKSYYGPTWQTCRFSAPKFNNHALSAARRYLNGGTVPSAFADDMYAVFASSEEADSYMRIEAEKKSASILAD